MNRVARLSVTALIVLLVTLSVRASAPPQAADRDLASRYAARVRPFLKSYCFECHSGSKPEASLDLSVYASLADVVSDHPRWAQVLEKLRADEMPPLTAERHPPTGERAAIVSWIASMRTHEMRKHAGDPGIVLARRLSNAEYNYTIRDLTGADIRPAREFPVDPANLAGFDNSGESLVMSPALLTKYLHAAREVATHLVLQPKGFTFAPHPMLVETDRDKYTVQRIVDVYGWYSTDLGDYFQAAWRYRHRAALGSPAMTIAAAAKAGRGRAPVSAKYLATVVKALEDAPDPDPPSLALRRGPAGARRAEADGPLAVLREMWKQLAPPATATAVPPAADIERMREFVTRTRSALATRVTPLAVKGISGTAQPFLMWRNHQYANNRMTCEAGATGIGGSAESRARFCAVFPDAFFISERGRYFPDNTRDTGRHLSAGFHNLMGYFRDDRPFYELMLDRAEQEELDARWRELDFVASANIRTYVQFYFNESGEARGLGRESEGPRPADRDVTSEAKIKDVAETYLARARAAGSDPAVAAIDEHFRSVNAGIRWVEKARIDAEPTHLAALQDFASRAYRRPLSEAERAGIVAYYRTLREQPGVDHEEAMRDSIASILVSPDFCYRIDLIDLDAKVRSATGDAAAAIHSLSDVALASRLSYFLWSSMPDAALMKDAVAGRLHRPEVLAAQARRMLKDPRVRGLVTEFGGNWLDFRRFEEHNAVDRERFTTFDNELRAAMFEEPIRFMLDVVRENRPVLDLIYGRHTFVNPILARHYGMPDPGVAPNVWVRVDDAETYQRGGLLPMSVFLTRNAPGLRTSPVKRGYWVVKQVLGEHIPPPPAAVPELPRDEAKLDLPLRDMLARHRQDKACASCHARFDSLGLVFEGYGPIGELRTTDLAGRAVDASATFPGGSTGSGIAGLRAYVRAHRQEDFVRTLSRKLLAYGLGRSLVLSDDLLLDAMRTKLAQEGYRFSALIDVIVTSPQFRTKRAGGELRARAAPGAGTATGAAAQRER
jgi:hypothetical protein